MSKLFVRNPVVHVPSFKEYRISGSELRKKCEIACPGIQVWPMSYRWYYHTDAEGWARLLLHLTVKSSLYVPDRRDCAWFAKKAAVTCNELYRLNTLPETWGWTPLGYHAFNSFYSGDAVMLFEPNDGFSEGEAWRDIWGTLDGNIVFQVGDNGYAPDNLFL